MEQLCEELFAPGPRLGPVAQLEVYREQFWLRHRGALEEDFRGVFYTVGADLFAELCRAYLAAHPSHSHTLRDLGQHFPAFLEGCDLLQDNPKLHRLACDMAKLEWAMTDAFDLAYNEPVAPEKLAQFPAEQWPVARFVFQPHLRMIGHTSWRIHELRKKAVEVYDDVDCACVDCYGVGVDGFPEHKPVSLLAFRTKNLRVLFLEAESVQVSLLQSLMNGAPLMEACEQAAEGASPEEVQLLEDSIFVWFQAWAAREWICDIYADPAETAHA